MPTEPYLSPEPDDGSASTPQISNERAAYNIVSDTVVGVNVRGKDNLFQALFILGSVIVLAGAGAIVAGLSDTDVPWWGGAIAGAFVGLVAGLFLSGIGLMIYRAVRHLKGKHD